MKTDRVIQKDIKEKITILVVEDNLLSRKSITSMLKNWGYKYDECANGKMALERIMLKEYDIVLMDIEMPQINGYDTTRYIRESLKLGLPIIAITSHHDLGDREKCLTAGMNDYLVKPIKEEALYNLITNYLFASVVLNKEIE